MIVSSATSIARSGLEVARLRLDVSAGNVANATTPSYKAASVVARPEATGGVRATVERADVPGQTYTEPDGRVVELSTTDLITETVQQIAAQRSFEANLAALKTADELEREAIDLLA